MQHTHRFPKNRPLPKCEEKYRFHIQPWFLKTRNQASVLLIQLSGLRHLCSCEKACRCTECTVHVPNFSGHPEIDGCSEIHMKLEPKCDQVPSKAYCGAMSGESWLVNVCQWQSPWTWWTFLVPRLGFPCYDSFLKLKQTLGNWSTDFRDALRFPSLPVRSFFAYGWKCCGCLRSVALMVYGLRWWVFGGPQITRLTKVESEPGKSFREEQGRLCLGGLEGGVPGSCGLERLVPIFGRGPVLLNAHLAQGFCWHSIRLGSDFSQNRSCHVRSLVCSFRFEKQWLVVSFGSYSQSCVFPYFHARVSNIQPNQVPLTERAAWVDEQREQIFKVGQGETDA